MSLQEEYYSKNTRVYLVPHSSADVILPNAYNLFPKRSYDAASFDGSEHSVYSVEWPGSSSAEPLVSNNSVDNEKQRVWEEGFPTVLQLIPISICLCLAVICLALDNTIIATAIPKITDEFGAGSLEDIGWYGSAYLLTTCAFQLLFGKLYTFYPIKPIFLGAIFLFEGGSAICGAAPSSTILIIGRSVAGIGCAGVYSGCYLIIAQTVPRRIRPTFTGLIGASYAAASICGPIVGGVFSDKLTWRWCFYVNLPIGLVMSIFIFFFFHSKPPAKTMSDMTLKAKILQFDPFGTAVFITTVTALLVALQYGGSKYSWSNARVIALLTVAAVGTLVFAAIQYWQGENATISSRLLKDRTVSGAAWFAAMLGGAYFICAYNLPLWFQSVKGLSPIDAGLRSTYMVISEVALSISTGIIVTRVGYYAPFILFSSILIPLGAGLLSTISPTTSMANIVGFQILLGAGIGSGSQHVQTAMQTVLPKEDVPAGTALATFAQSLGGAIFLSVAQSLFINKLETDLQIPGVKPNLIINAGASNLRTFVPQRYLPAVLIDYNNALRTTFYIAAAVGALSLLGAVLVEWKDIRAREAGDKFVA